MAAYKISGVWKDYDGEVSSYAVHHVFDGSISRALKKTKAQVILLLGAEDNTATTLLWNYATGKWDTGTAVRVAEGSKGKVLRCGPAGKLTDDLAHLMNYGWMGEDGD